MVIELSRYFGVRAAELKRRGVLNAHLGIDNRLFVDPYLLSALTIQEFEGSRQELTNYFSSIIKLVKASKANGDIAWQEAAKRLTVKEEHGAALGYSNAGGYGRAIGPELASLLVERAKQIGSGETGRCRAQKTRRRDSSDLFASFGHCRRLLPTASPNGSCSIATSLGGR